MTGYKNQSIHSQTEREREREREWEENIFAKVNYAYFKKFIYIYIYYFCIIIYNAHTVPNTVNSIQYVGNCALRDLALNYN